MTNETAADLLLQDVPFRSSIMQIRPEWIDYNGHLNMAYYNVMFDHAIDELWARIGIGPNYMKARGGSAISRRWPSTAYSPASSCRPFRDRETRRRSSP